MLLRLLISNRKDDALFMNNRKECELSLFVKELRQYMSPAVLNHINHT